MACFFPWRSWSDFFYPTSMSAVCLSVLKAQLCPLQLRSLQLRPLQLCPLQLPYHSPCDSICLSLQVCIPLLGPASKSFLKETSCEGRRVGLEVSQPECQYPLNLQLPTFYNNILHSEVQRRLEGCEGRRQAPQAGVKGVLGCSQLPSPQPAYKASVYSLEKFSSFTQGYKAVSGWDWK